MQRNDSKTPARALSRFAATTALALGMVAASAGGAWAQEAKDVRVSPPAAAAIQTAPLRIVLEAGTDSQVRGEAVIQVGEATSEVAIQLQGAEPSKPLAAFLVAGGCAGAGEVLAPLGAVQVDEAGTGQLSASIAVPAETLPATEFSIQIHPHGDAPSAVLACGANVPAASPSP